jgi:predicted RND superfamily exporter protein
MNKYRLVFGLLLITLSILGFFTDVWDKSINLFTSLVAVGYMGGFMFGCAMLIGET